MPFGVSWKVVFSSLRIVLVHWLALLSEQFLEVWVERDSLRYVWRECMVMGRVSPFKGTATGSHILTCIL